jgi:hypothetical protein
MSVRIIEATSGWAMGEVKGCLAVVWRAQPTPEAFKTRNEALKELVKQNAKHSALIEVVEQTSKPPDDATRRVAMEVFKELGSELSAIGFVLEGSQMKSALNRAILTTMTFFVKQLQPTKIFKHPADAVRWVQTQLQSPAAGFETELTATLEQLRAAIQK